MNQHKEDLRAKTNNEKRRMLQAKHYELNVKVRKYLKDSDVKCDVNLEYNQ